MTIRIGGDGADALLGSDLADFMFGQLGNDTFTLLKGVDQVGGWFGNDRFVVGGGHAQIDGGAGTDTVELAAGQWNVTFSDFGTYVGLINLSTGQLVALHDVEVAKIGSTSIKFVVATDKGTTITGAVGDNYIHANGGNDKITTFDGNDVVNGGSGADTIDTGKGNDVITDTDYVYNSSGHEKNVIKAGLGNDIVNIGFTYGDTVTYDIDGGGGTDIVTVADTYTAIKLTYNATTKASTLRIGSDGNYATGATLTGVEQVWDERTGDVLTLKSGVWTMTRPVVSTGTGTVLSEDIKGDTGNNTLIGGGGIDHFIGGKGTDTVVLSGRAEMYYARSSTGVATAKTVELHNSSDAHTPEVFIGTDVEKLKFTNGSGSADDVTYAFKVVTGAHVSDGTSGNDYMVVDPGASALPAGSAIALSGGNDFLFGHGALTRADGGSGNDDIQWSDAAKSAKFLGGSGDDLMQVSSYTATSGTTILDGGTGNDMLYFFGVNAGKLIGGDGDDVINGTIKSTMTGGLGNDSFYVQSFGPLPAGTVIGSIDGGDGKDQLQLGLSDQYILTKTADGVNVTIKYNNVTMSVSNVELIKFTDAPVLANAFTTYAGTSSANTKTGGGGVDLMHGGAGKDVLNGSGGNDTLAGDAGNDKLNGGSGNDTLSGGADNDTLTGGSGFDVFLFHKGYYPPEGADTVTDFVAGSGLGDVLAFEGDYRLASFSDVMKLAQSSADGLSTVFSFNNGDTITVDHVAKAAFVADDFYFF